ncbi:MAG: hypothetical protein LBL67_05060 [Coriobacteriales bacterium]|jgi:hypothetical protein|nr:hypothetical protein [Coriobacteriales bacterium]
MAGQQISFDGDVNRQELVQSALTDPQILAALVENLSLEKRRVRQFSAQTIDQVSQTEPQLLLPYAADLIDALMRPEAQTRWECLLALAHVVPLDPPACEGAVSICEDMIFEDRNATVRIAALRFMCAYGTTLPAHAKTVWPTIDEALQVFHGDIEYPDMLTAVLYFAKSKLPEPVRKALAERLEYDAENNRDRSGQLSAQIVNICRPGKPAKRKPKPTKPPMPAPSDETPAQRGGRSAAKTRAKQPKKADKKASRKNSAKTTE